MGDPAWSKTLNTFKAAFEEEPEKVTSDQRRVTSGRDSDLLVERLMWVSRMRTVALSIGDEKTRSEMLEYLCKKIEDGNNDPKDSLGDEVLTAIAEVLGGFEDFVGGPKEAHCLLKPLELLCQVDETTVRNQAVLAINQLAKQLTADQLFTHLVPLVVNLNYKSLDWFPPRISACGLVATAYSACVGCSTALTIDMRESVESPGEWAPAEAASKLVEMFKAQCKDEPMVRRTAATTMKDVAEAFGDAVTKDEIVELWCKLVESSEQDSIRVNALKSAPAIFKVVPLVGISPAGDQYREKCAKDMSWRVRVAVAESLPGVTQALKSSSLGADPKAESLKAAREIFAGLLDDKEAEVRHETAAQAAAAATVLPKAWAAEELFPKVVGLVLDENVANRVALAGVLVEMSEPLGADITKQKFLGANDELAAYGAAPGASLLQHLLSAETSTTNLRLQVIAKLTVINDVIGIKQGAPLFALMSELLDDKNWRVRHATMQLLPQLAREMGAADFSRAFSWAALGGDNCALIRTDWVKCCAEVAAVEGFGARWVEEHVLPKLLELSDSKNYQLKAVLLSAMDADFAKMLKAHNSATHGHQIVESLLLQKAIAMCSDKVPNLALQAVAAVGAVAISGAVDAAVIESDIKPTLLKCLKGEEGATVDLDVGNAAHEALQAWLLQGVVRCVQCICC